MIYKGKIINNDSKEEKVGGEGPNYPTFDKLMARLYQSRYIFINLIN